MRVLLIILMCLTFPLSAFAADSYDNHFCKDPEELKRWVRILADNPESDVVAALHALWVGLCVQVETHNLTTNRAQKIFDDFRWGLVESVERQLEGSEDKLGI